MRTFHLSLLFSSSVIVIHAFISLSRLRTTNERIEINGKVIICLIFSSRMWGNIVINYFFILFLPKMNKMLSIFWYTYLFMDDFNWAYILIFKSPLLRSVFGMLRERFLSINAYFHFLDLLYAMCVFDVFYVCIRCFLSMYLIHVLICMFSIYICIYTPSV